jgi:hypothetical protein
MASSTQISPLLNDLFLAALVIFPNNGVYLLLERKNFCSECMERIEANKLRATKEIRECEKKFRAVGLLHNERLGDSVRRVNSVGTGGKK